MAAKEEAAKQALDASLGLLMLSVLKFTTPLVEHAVAKFKPSPVGPDGRAYCLGVRAKQAA